jgi:tetratricopeptide (TPR) repeat protein
LVAGCWHLSVPAWLAPDAATLALVDALSTTERHVDAKEWEAALATSRALCRRSRKTLNCCSGAPCWPNGLAILTPPQNTAPVRWRNSAVTKSSINVALGMNRFRAGDLDGATAAADRAATLQPEEPQVHFLYGNIAEERGDISAALDAFDRAATLAEANDPQLTVISKMRYGMLLQQLQTMPMPGEAQAPSTTDTAPAATPAP